MSNILIFFLNYILFYLFNLFTCLHQVLVVAWRIQFPDQGSNPGHLHWEYRVLATGPPGKSQGFNLLNHVFSKREVFKNLNLGLASYIWELRMVQVDKGFITTWVNSHFDFSRRLESELPSQGADTSIHFAVGIDPKHPQICLGL